MLELQATHGIAPRASSLGSYAVARATFGSTARRCRFKGVCSVEAHAEKLPEERLKGKAFSGVSVLARMASMPVHMLPRTGPVVEDILSSSTHREICLCCIGIVG